MLKYSSYILLFSLITCWTLNPFLKKTIAKKIPSREYIIYNQCLCSAIVLVYAIYLFKNNTYDTSFLKTLTSKEIFISSIGAIVTIAASLLLIQLLKDNDASSVIPQIQPCIILLTLLIGYFIFNETVTGSKIIGTFLIITGLIFINN